VTNELHRPLEGAADHSLQTLSYGKAGDGMNSKRRHARGFTLVELLVVVSIIALLISILLPSLRSARDQSKRLVCRSNLRNIWTGILMYSYEYSDRVPYLESVNVTDPNADPFDSDNPNTVGRVLYDYVQEKNWVCPAAVNGYPLNAGRGNWTMTYEFSTADRLDRDNPLPYDQDEYAYTLGSNDPAIENYIHFDGRPMRLLDGRRYVAHEQKNANHNAKGYWKARFPIIYDLMAGDPLRGRPIYPHRGPLDARDDLGYAREAFQESTGGLGKKTGYHELHADGDKVETLFTRFSLSSIRP